ncbi:hypothetical protein NM688_g2528 [Phlebia brevispora]|uniref:Uncharacterized protein n=1 Tax=Phlebia brevispora TaxID=194682 RepID=A0ACC1T895_9APHY|nr:hypothetical protein NM688_g2528 [Phlebia brevispora]
MADPNNITALRESHGALVLGCYFGLFFSGILAMQTYLYFKLYSQDAAYLKTLVRLLHVATVLRGLNESDHSAARILDFFHTVMACNANWTNIIIHFGDYDMMDHISWSIAVTVAITATVTFIVHCFFIHRIYLLSRGNKFLTVPLTVLALFRLVAALVSTAEMIRLASYNAFVEYFAYVFTMGLGSAVALDIFITAGLTYYLSKNRSSFSTMNEVVDTLILYAVETGMLTCVTTVVSLICWLKMPHNLIFLGLHLTISKLYANSLLASLNSRATLRARKFSSNRDGDIPLPILFSSNVAERSRHSRAPDELKQMAIHIEKSVHTETTEDIVDIEKSGGVSHAESDYSSNEMPNTKSSKVVGIGVIA